MNGEDDNLNILVIMNLGIRRPSLRWNLTVIVNASGTIEGIKSNRGTAGMGNLQNYYYFLANIFIRLFEIMS